MQSNTAAVTLNAIDADAIVRVASSRAAFGLSPSSRRRQIRDGLLLAPFDIGDRSHADLRHEVVILNAIRAAGLPKEDIRRIVRRLSAQRAELSRQVLGTIRYEAEPSQESAA